MKEAVCKDMKESNCPLRFWDYCLERRVQIYNLTSHDHIKVRGSNPHTETFGEQGDISNLCQFRWYQWCYFRDHKAPFPHNQEVLGCVLGPARGEGNELSQWVLKSNGNVELSAHSNLMRCIVTQKNVNGMCLMPSLRGDGGRQ